MSKVILIMVAMIIHIPTFTSQEICNNGIDDDGDGLIDLNDNECDCQSSGSIAINSIIPNPSFELKKCCPSSYGQLSCAGSWIQASNATTDYLNICDFDYNMNLSTLYPFPDGDAVAGLIARDNWKEYLGSCLLSPMLAGTSYTLKVDVGFTLRTSTGPVVTQTNFPPFEWTLYGATSCGNIPFAGYSCPSSPFIILGSTPVITDGKFHTLSITFTPTVDINEIILGSPCDLPPQYKYINSTHPYFLVDNLLLNTSAVFQAGNTTISGTLCKGDLKLSYAPIEINSKVQWYKNGIAIQGQTSTTLMVSDLSLGAGNFQLVETTSNGCVLQETIVTGPTPPSFNTSIIQSSCNIDNGRITIVPAGMESYEYTWSPAVSTSNTAQQLAPNTYSVSIDNNGCKIDTAYTILPSTRPEITINFKDIDCQKLTAVTEIIVTNATLPVSFLWNTMETSSNIVIENNNLYNVKMTDAMDCTVTEIVSFPSIQSAQATASAKDSICEGDQLQLNGLGAPNSTYMWNGPNSFLSFEQNPTIVAATLASSGIYYLTTTTIDCFALDSVMVNVAPLPEISFYASDSSGCSPLTVQFINEEAKGQQIYTWEFGDNTSVQSTGHSITKTYSRNGEYSVTVSTISEGCYNSLTKDNLIKVAEWAKASFSSIITSPYGGKNSTVQFINQSEEATKYRWYFGDVAIIDTLQNPIHTYPNSNANYEVVLIANNENNCPDSTSRTISIEIPPIFYVPNTFTPDNNEYNNLFHPVFEPNFEPQKYQLNIYNRWGQLVFNSTSSHIGWNGTYQDLSVKDGTYSWELRFNDPNDDHVYVEYGYVNVLK